MESFAALPSAVKIPLPDKFSGEMDYERVTSFLFQVEHYCSLVGLTDEQQKAALTIMLLTEDARTWYMHQGYTGHVTYTTLSAAMCA